jgi:hypothetical protein
LLKFIFYGIDLNRGKLLFKAEDCYWRRLSSSYNRRFLSAFSAYSASITFSSSSSSFSYSSGISNSTSFCGLANLLNKLLIFELDTEPPSYHSFANGVFILFSDITLSIDLIGWLIPIFFSCSNFFK